MADAHVESILRMNASQAYEAVLALENEFDPFDSGLMRQMPGRETCELNPQWVADEGQPLSADWSSIS